MSRYIRRPQTVEAWQFEMKSSYPPGQLPKGLCNSISCHMAGNNLQHVHTVHESEDGMGQIVILSDGDWIIPESDGVHFYPVKPDVFEATYEAIHDPIPDDDYKFYSGFEILDAVNE